ncbi:MAG: hypothetical protein COB51_07955 [Moraxellaceae bacterium]|nr:MAG: hypothetical protein COB51_07955 [Moraxellaceae bacterium]
MQEFSPNTAALMALNPVLCLAISLIFLASCGQKGALYSPDPAHQPNTAASILEPRPHGPLDEEEESSDTETLNVIPQPASDAEKAEETNPKAADKNVAATHQ